MERWPTHLRVIGQAAVDWWDDIVNIIVINLIWLVCWITILLGPPATLGIYHVTNRLAHGESVGVRGFLEASKRYALQGWMWLLLNLAVTAIIVVNFWYYAAFEDAWADWLKAFFVLLGILWLVVQFYALPFLIEQERKHMGIALRNGLFNALAAPGYTLVVFSSAVVAVVLSVGLVFPLFLGGPCLVAVLGNRAVIERLETYGVRERDSASKGSDPSET